MDFKGIRCVEGQQRDGVLYLLVRLMLRVHGFQGILLDHLALLNMRWYLHIPVHLELLNRRA